MEVNDVEELISIGEEVKACPYYGSRYALSKAEVSIVPWKWSSSFRVYVYGAFTNNNHHSLGGFKPASKIALSTT